MRNKEAIKKEAKDIMDKFMQALGSIDIKDEFVLKRKNCFREEKNGRVKDDDFKQRFLDNAPQVSSSGAIVANKGEWTK